MDASTLEALGAALGPDQVKTEAAALDARRFDYWAVNHLRDWRGEPLPRPGCVVCVRSVADVQAVLAVARERGTPVMPWGLGSGVCGGVVGNPAAIVLDLGEMNAVREIDEVNLLGHFDAGTNGLAAEEAAAARGLTIAHWPQSIGVSSVGGWVSTRASGQFSSAYGNIEDIVYSIEAVLPTGEFVTLGKAPRAAAGPDLRHVVMGAEGTLGVVTGVTLSLRRAAEARAYTAFYTPSMEVGFEAQRRIVQADWRPPVMRQYDAPEVKRNFRDHVRGESGVLLMVHEGPASRVDVEIAALREIAADAGLDEASAAIAETWMENRNHVPHWRDLFERNIVVDTIEISAPWTRIGQIYRAAIASLGEVDGIVNASAHSSHVYRSGLNLYFSFAVLRPEHAELEAAYFECWHRVMEATAAHGGGIAHHHGAGRLRKPYLVHDLGEGGVALLRRIKGAVDPDGIMNPGNLIPDA